MPERFEYNPTHSQSETPQQPQGNEWNKQLKRKVLHEMKEMAYTETPKAEEDWDLIWVLSGPPSDIEMESTKESRNESRERLETGIKVAREVTALRLKRAVKDITVHDILNNGPDIYWNAKDEANDNLRKRAGEGLLESRYNFPREKLIISPNSGIKHTGDQFKKFPAELEKKSRRVVLISDIYHLPRVKRYFRAEYNIIPPKKIILYPSEPRMVPIGNALREIKKIPGYIRGKSLPEDEGKEKK